MNAGGSSFSYAIPLADGDYQVTLHLAERYSAITGTGQRVFDVRFEAGEAGEQTVEDVDVWAAVGPDAAYDIDRTVTVRGDTLNVQFARKVDNATIQAITVVPVAEVKPRPARLPMLTQKAIRLLAGQGTLNCATGTVQVQLTESALTVGAASYPIEALLSVELSALANSELYLALTYLVNGVQSTVSLVLGADGSLQSITSAGFSCTQGPFARWGNYDGQAAALLNAIEKPRPSYPQVPMTCSGGDYSLGPGGGGPTTRTLWVGASDYRAWFRSPDGSIDLNGLTWVDLSQVLNGVEGYGIKILASSVSTYFGFMYTSSVSLTVSDAGVLLNAYRSAYKSTSYQCSR